MKDKLFLYSHQSIAQAKRRIETVTDGLDETSQTKSLVERDVRTETFFLFSWELHWQHKTESQLLLKTNNFLAILQPSTTPELCDQHRLTYERIIFTNAVTIKVTLQDIISHQEIKISTAF